LAEQIFTDNGVLAIEHADFEGVERLAKVFGAEIASTFGDPKAVKLGHCDLIEEVTSLFALAQSTPTRFLWHLSNPRTHE
jgi:chaperonin GroEL (HSP60 family)